MKIGACLTQKQIDKLYSILKNKFTVIQPNEIQVPSIKSKLLRSREIPVFEKKGIEIANQILQNVKTDKPVHVELSWKRLTNSGTIERHAMGLIYVPKKYLEFFDPSGYTHKPTINTTNFDADKIMHYILNAIQKKLNVPFNNLNTKPINVGGHCNAWTIYYHILRHNDLNINSNTFKKKYVTKWHNIDNAKTRNEKFQKEYNIYGPVHKLFLNPKKTLLENVIAV